MFNLLQHQLYLLYFLFLISCNTLTSKSEDNYQQSSDNQEIKENYQESNDNKQIQLNRNNNIESLKNQGNQEQIKVIEKETIKLNNDQNKNIPLIDNKENISASIILQNLNFKKLKIGNYTKNRTSLVDYSLFSNFNKEDKKQLVIKSCNDNYVINRSIGSILGMSIGDSVGAPLEFISIKNLGINQTYKYDLIKNKYHNEYNKFKLKRGQWTDDASMGLCMADSLIINKGYDGSDIRTRFWNWWNKGYNNAFRNDNSRNKESVGLGGNISNSLNLETNKKPSNRYNPSDSSNYKDDSGNGSLMRLAPIPIFFKKDIKKAIEMSKESSYTTLPGHTAAEACGLLGFIIVKAINRNPNDKTDIRTFLENTLNEYLKILEQEKELLAKDVNNYNKLIAINNIIRLIKSNENINSKEYCWNWKSNIEEYKIKILQSYDTRKKDKNYNGYPVSNTYWGAYSIDGVAMALNSIYNSNSFGSAIENAVNLLGDADSTGSITGQIAGAFYGFNYIYNNNFQKKFIVNISKWDNWEIPLRAVFMSEINKIN